MSGPDRRSVGELLLEGDVTTRGLLFDTRGEDALAMLRTWGEVVQSAAELWDALPAPISSRNPHSQAMAQLEAIGQAMHRNQLRQNWPIAGPSDSRLLTVADGFARAANLVRRHGERPAQPLSAAVESDVQAARTRIMHTLYVGAHAVSLSVREHINELRCMPGVERQSTRVTRGIPRGTEALERLTAFEQLAGTYLGSRVGRALGGERLEAYAGLDRLGTALASWDLASHRILASVPTPAHLSTVARTQALASRTALVLLHAAAQTRVLDRTTYEHRLAPPLDEGVRAWSRIGGQWDQLANVTTRGVDPDLWSASAELHAAARELVHDKSAVATPDAIAARADLHDLAPTLSLVVNSGLEIACLVRDLAANDQRVSAPAQLLLEAARTNAAGMGPADVDDLGMALNPRQLQHNRVVPLIATVRFALVRSSESTIESMRRASSATAALWSPIGGSRAGTTEDRAAARESITPAVTPQPVGAVSR